MASFIFLEHFFQFFLIVLLLGYGILIFIIKSIVLKYPEMLKDGLSIFSIITYPFKHKSAHLEKAQEQIDKANEKYDEYESKYDNLIYNLFYPLPLVLIVGSLGGYIFYFVTNLESSIIFNIASVVIIYIVAKKFKKNKVSI